MSLVVLFFLLGLQVKHFVADYLLQFDWMVAEKGDLLKPGGYAHAGMHVLGTAIVLIIAGVRWPLLVAILAAEFVIHYALDYGKVAYSNGVTMEDSPQKYFALHGLDQFFHHLTYIGITYVALFTDWL